MGIVAAGAPARLPVFDTAAVLDSVPHQVDPATFPAITIGQDVTDWNHAIEGRTARDIVMTMAENLEIENQAVLRRDRHILRRSTTAIAWRRCRTGSRRGATGTRSSATTGSIRWNGAVIPFGVQTGLSLGLTGTGDETEET